MEELIEDFLQEAEIGYDKQYDEDGDPLFNMEMALDCGDFKTGLLISREFQTVNFFTKCPVNVPAPKRREVAEYIARANFHNYEGALKLDCNDGNIFYQYVLRYNPDADLDQVIYQLSFLFSISIEEMETHFPGILSVVYNNSTPAEAFNKAELGSNPELN